MIQFLFFIVCLTTPILSAPSEGEAHLDLVRDHQGGYKFTLTSLNVTRAEENFPDGSVKGSYSYLTSKKERQTASYNNGFEGLTIEGKYPIGAEGQEPQDLPEVLEAKRQFLVIAENAKKFLTVHGADKPATDENREEFLNIVSKELNPELKGVFSPRN
ncbi:hypothetical protein Trydic_g456 [Trypoxylus dichotomus]